MLERESGLGGCAVRDLFLPPEPVSLAPLDTVALRRQILEATLAAAASRDGQHVSLPEFGTNPTGSRQNPDAFRPNLAMSLAVQGQLLKNRGQRGDALKIFEEGIAVLTPHFLNMPDAFRELIMVLVNHYLATAEELETEPSLVLLAPILDSVRERSTGDAE